VRLTINLEPSAALLDDTMAYIGRCGQSRVFIPQSSSSCNGRLQTQPLIAPTPRGERSSGASGAQCVALAGPYTIIVAGPSLYLCASDSPRDANNSTPKNDSHGSNGTTPAIMLEEPSSNKVMIEIPSSEASDITALAIDQSWTSPSPSGQYDQKWNASSSRGGRREGTIHVAAFHCSGHFDIFSVVAPHPYLQHHNDALASGGSLVDSEADSRFGPDFVWSNYGANPPRSPFSGSSSGSNAASECGHKRAPGLTSTDVKLVYSHSAPPSSPRAPGVEVPLELDSRAARMSNVICAAYHHPLLITLSQAFHLLVYYLPDTSSHISSMATSLPLKPVLVRSIHSYTSHPPSSMSLARVPASSVSATHVPGASAAAGSNGRSNAAAAGSSLFFKLVLAYTVPVYPAHWTAAAAELAISVIHHHHSTDDGNQATTDSTGTMGHVNGRPEVRILSSRTASAMPTGWHEIPVGITSTLSPSDDEDGGGGDGAGEDEPQADSEWAPSVRSTSASVSASTSSGSTSTSKPATVPSSGQNQGRGDVRNATPWRSEPSPSKSTTHARRDGRDRKRSHSTSASHALTLATHRDLTMRLRIANAMEQWGRKVGNVVGTQTDGKWIVIAGNDNVLQVSSMLPSFVCFTLLTVQSLLY
jgi:hypothetical protein